MALPFLLVGDHPQLPSGLGRILRDLAQHLAHDPTLDLDVRIVGCRPEGAGPDGLTVEIDTYEVPIPVWSFTATDDFGQVVLDHVRWAWARWWGGQSGVVLSIWDAARIYQLAQAQGPWELWSYLPVDGEMPRGSWQGPVAEMVQRASRVLAYGRYGAEVLRPLRAEPLQYLPHGLPLHWYQGQPAQDPVERQRWLGCVMTNQPRKDWGVMLATLAELRQRGHKVKLWAHVDRTEGPAWSLPQLVETLRVPGRALEVTSSADYWSDEALRDAYARCSVVVLPSLGEGFGYPLVEALASGTPAVHTTHAGGAELVPRPEWKVPVRATRIDGPAALVRPVYEPSDWANAIERVWAWQARWPDQGRSYCQGAVAHLEWRQLWPRWRAWVTAGLEARED